MPPAGRDHLPAKAPAAYAAQTHGNASVASGGTTVTSSGGAAQRYAAALYDYASDQQSVESVVAEMQALGRLIQESADFRRLLASPLLDLHTAQKAAHSVLVAEGFGETVQNFVGVVAANRRLALLPTIVRAFAALVAEKRGVVVADVTTAHPLTDVQEQQLRARLIEAGYGNVDIAKHVDPSLLGGLVVRVGARLYDTSLRSRLQRLQFAMKGAA